MGFHVGQTFGDYSITALAGAGGMGRVYKVEHSLTKRTEAMKVLVAEDATEIQIKRFEREMRVLARLSHPNIAAIHNAHHSEKQLILFMEYVEGQTLESMFSSGRLPLGVGIGYIKQMLSALGYAHQRGVVHRDVSPANVIISSAGEVKLTDFGLSKSYGDPLLTNCGEVLGSLPYMAPEQVKGKTQPDRRSDLYSVGAILYEHLTGQKPFGANRRLSAILTDSEAEPAAPSGIERGLDSRWDEVIRRTLAKDPVHRYQSAEEFLEALAHFDEPVEVDLPMPQLRALGSGVAIFAGLVLALAASVLLSRFRQEGIAPPRFGISPPAFAFTLPAVRPASLNNAAALGDAAGAKPGPIHDGRKTTGAAMAKAAQATEVRHVKQVARSVDDVPVTAASASDAQPDTESRDQNIDTLVAGDADAGVSPKPAKKRIWSKLNIFKKKQTDDQDGQ